MHAYGAPTENTEAVREVLEASLATTLAELGTDAIRGVYTTVGHRRRSRAPGPSMLGRVHHLGIQVYLVLRLQRVRDQGLPPRVGVEHPTDSRRKRFFKDDWGPSAGAAVDLRLSHPDTAVLTQAADDVLERLRSYSDLTQIESSLASASRD